MMNRSLMVSFLTINFVISFFITDLMALATPSYFANESRIGNPAEAPTLGINRLPNIFLMQEDHPESVNENIIASLEKLEQDFENYRTQASAEDLLKKKRYIQIIEKFKKLVSDEYFKCLEEKKLCYEKKIPKSWGHNNVFVAFPHAEKIHTCFQERIEKQKLLLEGGGQWEDFKIYVTQEASSDKTLPHFLKHIQLNLLLEKAEQEVKAVPISQNYSSLQGTDSYHSNYPAIQLSVENNIKLLTLNTLVKIIHLGLPRSLTPSFSPALFGEIKRAAFNRINQVIEVHFGTFRVQEWSSVLTISEHALTTDEQKECMIEHYKKAFTRCSKIIFSAKQESDQIKMLNLLLTIAMDDVDIPLEGIKVANSVLSLAVTEYRQKITQLLIQHITNERKINSYKPAALNALKFACSNDLSEVFDFFLEDLEKKPLFLQDEEVLQILLNFMRMSRFKPPSRRILNLLMDWSLTLQVKKRSLPSPLVEIVNEAVIQNPHEAYLLYEKLDSHFQRHLETLVQESLDPSESRSPLQLLQTGYSLTNDLDLQRLAKSNADHLQRAKPFIAKLSEYALESIRIEQDYNDGITLNPMKKISRKQRRKIFAIEGSEILRDLSLVYRRSEGLQGHVERSEAITFAKWILADLRNIPYIATIPPTTIADFILTEWYERLKTLECTNEHSQRAVDALVFANLIDKNVQLSTIEILLENFGYQNNKGCQVNRKSKIAKTPMATTSIGFREAVVDQVATSMTYARKKNLPEIAQRTQCHAPMPMLTPIKATDGGAFRLSSFSLEQQEPSVSLKSTQANTDSIPEEVDLANFLTKVVQLTSKLDPKSQAYKLVAQALAILQKQDYLIHVRYSQTAKDNTAMALSYPTASAPGVLAIVPDLIKDDRLRPIAVFTLLWELSRITQPDLPFTDRFQTIHRLSLEILGENAATRLVTSVKNATGAKFRQGNATQGSIIFRDLKTLENEVYLNEPEMCVRNLHEVFEGLTAGTMQPMDLNNFTHVVENYA